MKRILSALLSIAMLLALSVTASAAEFPDVPAGSTYAQAVQWVSQQGYINGYNDGRFGVNDNVTRAQLSAILYRAAGSPAASGTTRFPDVAATAYYAGAASWAADGGLINGYSDGRFGVNDPITRQQVTAIFWRWAGSPAASAEDYADEASISNYAKTAVDWARANSIVPAKDGNRFAPTDNATRGEIALILYNYMNRNSQPVTPSAGNGAKVLVAYFSATGSTQAVANTIASTLNADTFEITPANPYSSADLNWTDSSSRVNDEHDNVSKRNIALVKDSPDNWADYDVVFIGYPIWWGDMPMVMYTFFETHDFAGKTIIPFNTHGGSGFSSTISTIRGLEPQAEVLDGLSISRDRIQDAERQIVD